MKIIWRAGDSVRIGFGGRSVDGSVMFGSKNGRSLILKFEALLGGYVGTMPVLWSEADGAFLDLLTNRRVTLELLAKDGIR